jgi:hypothetical protein
MTHAVSQELPAQAELRTDLTSILLVAAAIALGYALQWSHGHYHPEALRIVVAAWVATLAALVVRFSFRFRLLELFLGGGLMAQLYLMAVSPPTVEMPGLTAMTQLNDFFLGLAIVGVLVGSGLADKSPLQKYWFPAVVLVHFLMGRLILNLAPNPTIDVFTVEIDGLKALLSGDNPYAITMRNAYGDDNSPFYPPGVSINGRLQFGFVYPPLTLLLCVPGWLIAHDPRYSTMVAMSVAALFMGYARPGNLGKLAATLFLFTPRTWFVIDRAWTDSFIVMLTSAVAFTALRKPKWLFIPVGLFACLKQHMFIGAPAIFLLLPRPLDWRALWKLAWKSALVAMAITLPFFLWSPSAFSRSVLDIREVYRTDCLSLVSYLANTNVVKLSKWSGLIAIVPVIALGLWRAPRTATGFAALVAATHFTVYVFSTHAFCNEYYNVVGALCLAVAVWKPETAVAKGVAVPLAVPAEPVAA